MALTVVTAGSEPALSDRDREQFLDADTLVPVGDPILEPILAEIHALRADESKAATARAIYNWIVDNVEYKKIGTGWGNGDTYWACSERYGNCTDFHALFISLARSEGIPARFEIGFPVPTGRDLILSETSKTVPLNYFIYPYVEVGGKPWKVKLDSRFSYREIKPLASR